MHSRVLIVICVVMMTATDGAHGHLFQCWLTRGQLPASCPHVVAAAPASRDEALPASALDTAWSKVADDTRNSVMYFVETKKELFLFDEAPTAPALLTTPGTTTDTDAASASTRATEFSPIAPTTSTSAPTTGTSAPATITRPPASSTDAPTTITSAPSTSTSAPATSTSAPNTGTSEPSTSSNALLLSSTIPPGYTYYPATRSSYKFYHDRYGSWHDANTTCAGEGAHLLVVNDAEEADIVARIVRDAASGPPYVWTGLRDNRPGEVMDWRTVHGEPLSDVYNVWGDGRPLNDAQYTYCAFFQADDKRLYDFPCDVMLYFTCEISQ